MKSYLLLLLLNEILFIFAVDHEILFIVVVDHQILFIVAVDQSDIINYLFDNTNESIIIYV